MGPDRERLRVAAQRAVAHAARRLGLDVVPAGFWSPIVDTGALPAETWERAAAMPGLELDLDAQLERLERLAPLMGELTAPVHRPPAGSAGAARSAGSARSAGDDFHFGNAMYGPMDAFVLYATVRELRPSRVLELGSGYSTLVIERALRANGESAVHVVVDPYPAPFLGRASDRVRDRLQIVAESAAAVPASMFTELGNGDLLFVDTSHVVVPGGEVVRLVLEVLPALAAGVVAHFHDIYRPFEYPRALYDAFGLHWQEQYLLQGFLQYNAGFEVLCANHALWRLRRERVASLLPEPQIATSPSALWFVRR